MPRNRKGAKLERELVNELDDAGFAVMRAPSSGAATDRALPDVLAGNGETFVAIEAKASKEKPIYIDEEEIVALEFFAENFGARPLIGVRFNREPWYFFSPADLYTTPSDNRRVKKETALTEGMKMSDLTNGL